MSRSTVGTRHEARLDTRIETLDGDERRAELERMLGGADFLATLRE